jgi:hypothetical protein
MTADIGMRSSGLRLRCLDRDELKQMSEIWGTQFADCLITHPNWPASNQPAAIVAASAIVELAIAGIAAILSESNDFVPHLKMISTTIRDSFRRSMPSVSSTRGR